MTWLPQDSERRLLKLGSGFSVPARRAAFFGTIYLCGLMIGAGALLARLGTLENRIFAGLLMLSPALGLYPLWRRAARERRHPELLAERAVRAVDPRRAHNLSQAVALVRRVEAAASGESAELAALHLRQVLDGVPQSAVDETGRRRGRWLGLFTFGLFVSVSGLALVRGFAIWEGLDILVSRGGIAPFAASYLDQVDVLVDPPPQVRGGLKRLSLLSPRAVVPVGSELRFSIVPRVAGRSFVLTDGLREEPFVSDGQGGLVAHLGILDPVLLRVAAVFGPVRIFDRESLQVATIEDYPPQVMLKGGRRELSLIDLERLEIEYLAHDDYGLSVIELVLRTGRREERTELIRLDGGERNYPGGHAVSAEHPLLRSAFLPVELWIEATDNNSISEPGRGKSEVVTLLPRPLGSVLSTRHRELRGFRGALVDYLASDFSGRNLDPAARRERQRQELTRLLERFSELESKLSLAGEPPRGSLQFLGAQLEAFDERADEARAEAVVLAADVLISELSKQDAQTVAHGLAAAVDEVAARMRDEEVGQSELATLLAATRAGADALLEIGELGLDLGAVAQGDLGRIERLFRQGQQESARAAAIHLAARLRRGTPSFGAKGAGVEAGPPMQGSGESTAPSTAPSDYDELTQQTDALAQEHAQELSLLEQMLEQASRAAAEDAARDPKLAEAAEQLRDALLELPSMARFPGTADSEAAQARNFGEAMADDLEAGRLVESLERGAAALESLERAEQLLDALGGALSQRELTAAREALQRAARQAEASRRQQQGSAESRARLAERAQGERELAQKARELLRRGREGEAKLPDGTLQALDQASRLMDDAARAMDQGDVDVARELAANAQRELERAQPERRQGDERSSTENELGDEGKMSRGAAEVPRASEDRAKDFRQRVEKGLGRYSGRFGPAVRRYAEELK